MEFGQNIAILTFHILFETCPRISKKPFIVYTTHPNFDFISLALLAQWFSKKATFLQSQGSCGLPEEPLADAICSMRAAADFEMKTPKLSWNPAEEKFEPFDDTWSLECNTLTNGENPMLFLWGENCQDLTSWCTEPNLLPGKYDYRTDEFKRLGRHGVEPGKIFKRANSICRATQGN